MRLSLSVLLILAAFVSLSLVVLVGPGQNLLPAPEKHIGMEK